MSSRRFSPPGAARRLEAEDRDGGGDPAAARRARRLTRDAARQQRREALITQSIHRNLNLDTYCLLTSARRSVRFLACLRIKIRHLPEPL
mmetsp:Transcript_3906/g.11676  ORF Transcript_3906/g.11676 Transcript_3906/m.11676 type:complete len:90 (+) Transcript_3906:475-744(+)